MSQSKREGVEAREAKPEQQSSGAVLEMTLARTLGIVPTSRRLIAELRADISAAVNLDLSKVHVLGEQGRTVEFSVEGDDSRSAIDIAQNLCDQIGHRDSPLHEGIHTCNALSMTMKSGRPGHQESGCSARKVRHANSSSEKVPSDSSAPPLVGSRSAKSNWCSGAADGLLVQQQSTTCIRPLLDECSASHQQASNSSTVSEGKFHKKGADDGAMFPQSRESTDSMVSTANSEKATAGCVVASELLQSDEASFQIAMHNLLQATSLLAPPELPDFESLVRACKLGKIGDIEVALLHGFNVDTRHSISGNTLLHFAAANGHKKICKLLLRMRADINAANNVGDTALHNALALNYRELGGYLYSKGADDSIPNHRGETCYETARGHPLAPDARTLGPYSVGAPRDLTAASFESEVAVAPSGPCAAEKASNKAGPISTQDNSSRSADPGQAPPTEYVTFRFFQVVRFAFIAFHDRHTLF